MGLKAERQTFAINRSYTNPFQTERGGIACLVRLSGIYYAAYENNPTAQSIPLGIQAYDFEENNIVTALPSWRARDAISPFSRSPIITEGTVITNFIHPEVMQIDLWSNAYLAPSGLITNTTNYGGVVVGKFLSRLNDNDIGVVGQSSVRVGGVESIRDPQRVMVPTAGWAKLRIQIL